MVRMTFIPHTWHEIEDEANSILRDNLENAVRQLTIEQRIISAFKNDEEIITIEPVDETEALLLENCESTGNEIEGVVEESGDHSRSEESEENIAEDKKVLEIVVQELDDLEEDEEYSYVRDEEVLEPIEEQSEERIDNSEESQEC